MFRKILTSFLSLTLIAPLAGAVFACNEHKPPTIDVATKIMTIIAKNHALFCSANTFPPTPGTKSSDNPLLLHYLKKTLIQLSAQIYPDQPLTNADLVDWNFNTFNFDTPNTQYKSAQISYFNNVTQKEGSPITIPVNYYTDTHYADQIATKITNLNFLQAMAKPKGSKGYISPIKAPSGKKWTDPDIVKTLQQDIQILNPKLTGDEINYLKNFQLAANKDTSVLANQYNRITGQIVVPEYGQAGGASESITKNVKPDDWAVTSGLQGGFLVPVYNGGSFPKYPQPGFNGLDKVVSPTVAPTANGGKITIDVSYLTSKYLDEYARNNETSYGQALLDYWDRFLDASDKTDYNAWTKFTQSIQTSVGQTTLTDILATKDPFAEKPSFPKNYNPNSGMQYTLAWSKDSSTSIGTASVSWQQQPNPTQ